MIRDSRPILFLLAFLATACGEGARGPTATVTDSAGVQIVTSTAPAWGEGDGWVVDSVPSLDIGGSETDPHYDLVQVSGLARLHDGRIAVLSAGSSQLLFYDSASMWISSSGRAGDGPGEFRSPYKIFRMPGDTLATFDYQLQRLSRFGPDGTFLSSVSASQAAGGRFAVPLARMSDGSWVATASAFTFRSESGVMRRPEALLHLSADFGAEADTIAILPGNETWVESVKSGQRLLVSIRGLPLGLSSASTASDSLIFAGDNARYVINVYEPDGTLLRSIRRSGARRPVTGEMLARLKANELEGVGAEHVAEAEERWEKYPKPAEMPAFDDLTTDAAGNLWVMEPRVLRSDAGTADVFDPSGRLLGSVALPASFAPFVIGSDYLLGVWKDDMGLEHVRMYGIVKGG